jgi:L-ascorbate metabolism protein UlaG (beta-lactamase superfamily)
MKVTRYFQSCLLIEVDGARILIDPCGHDKETDFGKLDAVFYTHEHMDHFDAGMAQAFVEQGVAAVYANASTAKQVKASVTTTEDGKEYDVNGVKVKAIELPHCLMVDGSTSVQNTGYLVDGELFHPGDGKELDGLTARILAVPLTGPDISAHDAFAFGKQVQAEHLIPIHYDYMGGNPDFFARTAGENGMETHSLDRGKSAEI